MLVYVDNLMFVSHDPIPTLENIDKIYQLKEGSLGKPDTYLGGQIYEHHLNDGRKCWGMKSEKYIKSEVQTVEDLLREDGDGLQLNTTTKTPIPHTYRPELDITPELNGEHSSRNRQMIGILRWAVKLGRVDMHHEVALMSQYSASPREGHIEAVYDIFAFLKTHPRLNIVLDPRPVPLDENAFANVELSAWRDLYGDVAEELPPKMPAPLGNTLDITCFVDSDHTGDVVTRRSHTGIIIFLNNAPVIWFSKKQKTVESSSFGTEFVALRIARNLIMGLRYKLRMFGVPIVGPASVLCDNQGVVKNTSLPDLVLSKHHNAINYNVVQEAEAAGIIRVGKEEGPTNLGDVFTKMLPRNRMFELFSRIAYSSMFMGDVSGKRRAGMEEMEESGQPEAKKTSLIAKTDIRHAMPNGDRSKPSDGNEKREKRNRAGELP